MGNKTFSILQFSNKQNRADKYGQKSPGRRIWAAEYNPDTIVADTVYII
jgi:hypothetical protein